MENVDPSDVAYQLAHINDNKTPATLAAQVTCLAVAYIGVILRFVSRRLSKARIEADDYVTVLALFLYTAASVDGFICLALGAGKHEITLKNPDAFAKASFAFIVLYRPSIAAVKFSVIFLYRRIFPQASFRLLLDCYGIVVLVFTVVFTLLDIIHCKPVQSAWKPNVTGSCLSLDTIWVVGGSLNAVTDIAALLLPMPLLWRLHVTKEKRLQIMSVFLLGGFVCIVSIVRVVELNGLQSSVDPSYIYATTIIWSTIEVGVGIFCACLPVLRPILLWAQRYDPVLLGLPRRPSKKGFRRDGGPHVTKSWPKPFGFGNSISGIETSAPYSQVEPPSAHGAEIIVTTQIEQEMRVVEAKEMEDSGGARPNWEDSAV